jgi:predicted nuclease of restriction endonuclease-like RecB superfamily
VTESMVASSRTLPVVIGQRRHLDLLTEADLPWIGELVHRLAPLAGRPWREASEALAEVPCAARPRHRAAVLESMRFLLVPTRERIRGTHVRRELFGAPALDAAARTARIEQAATSLGISPEHLLRILWTDLAKQRVVEVARPLAPREVAAEANVRLIQRIVGRCYELRLQIRGDATTLVRAAAVRGLLTSSAPAGPHDNAGGTELVISGPLTVFHHTTVYGRTLCALVRHLSATPRFVLDARCDLGYGPVVFRVEAPVILPPPPAAQTVTPTERALEKDLARDAPDWTVERTPTAYVLRRGDATWRVEVVGYWTVEYIAGKLASQADLIVCFDGARSLGQEELPAHPRVVRFERRVPIPDLLAIIATPAAGSAP